MHHGNTVIAVLLVVTACSQGPVGLQGPVGPQGPTGPAGPSGATPSGYFDVLAYGAKADMPSFDSTASFQSALDAAHRAGGGIVWVPQGRFWFSGNLSIASNVALAGAGVGPYDPYQDPTTSSVAPTLLPSSSSGPAFISIDGENSALQNLLIHYPNQVLPDAPGVETAGPTVYPPTVLALQPSKILGCTFDNSYIAIQVMVGRVYLENLHIGGFKNDIVIDHSADFVHISHVTMSVFWDRAFAFPTPIDFWVMNHGTALTSSYQDGIEIDDFDVFWRNTGIAFLDSPQGFGVTWGVASNIDIDSVQYGVIAKSVNESVGVLFTNLIVGPGNGLGVNMIWLPAGGQHTPSIVVEGGSTRGSWIQPLKVEAGTLTVRDVVGLNPIGRLPALGIAPPALPPSGTPYVSGMPADARVSIRGGSVQDVRVGGQSTGLTTGMFEIAPGESIAVVYARAPDWSWFLE